MTLLRSLPSLKVVVIPTKFSNIFDDIGAKDTSLADALQDCEMMCISQKYIQLAWASPEMPHSTWFTQASARIITVIFHGTGTDVRIRAPIGEIHGNFIA